MAAPSYREPIKDEARFSALSRAVEILTTRRNEATCVPRTYVRAVRDQLLKQGGIDAQVAAQLDDEVIRRWEQLHTSQVGRRKPGELTVCYLCGPEPKNDFDVLVGLGVHPNNIWAFESDEKLYQAAVEAVRQSDFPSLKIHHGSIEHFFISTPKRFDIIYLDACGPLPSIEQRTLRMVASALRHHRLASPGVLVTNFALPPIVSHSQFVATYLYPKQFLEYEHTDGSAGYSDSAEAHSLQLNSPHPGLSFLSRVQASFPDYYSQYITRQIMDLASIVVPWTRTISAEYWKRFFAEPARTFVTVAEQMADMDSGSGGENYGNLADYDLTGNVVCQSGDYPLQWTLRFLRLQARGDSELAKLLNAWVAQMTGLPQPGGQMDSSTAILCNDVLRTKRRWDTPGFSTAIKAFDSRDKLFQFCDVPMSTLAFDAIVNQLAFPMHYVTEAVRRWRYIAKQTEMFLDVMVLDECRYIYDWLPSVDLVRGSAEDLKEQLSYRFALDGLNKNRRWYNMEYFQGTAVIDQFLVPGFKAKVLMLRQPVSPREGPPRKLPRLASLSDK